MFNLDNLDLDFDDDFSSNIFSKGACLDIKNEVDKNEISKEVHFSNPSTSKCEENDPRAQKLQDRNESRGTSSRSFIDLPLMTEFKENNLKRLSLQNEKPQKKRLSHDVLLRRKFPGPAGLLPDEPMKELNDLSFLMEKPRKDKQDEEDRESSMVYSQNSGSLFLSSNYQKLLSDFHLNESNNPLSRYTVEWVKKTALSKGFQGRKIPFLGLIVHSVNQGMPDPVLVLRDPTGEILGSLHREVWGDMGGKLRAGVALALRQVGVLITGVIRRQIYLNVTMNNVLSLYGPAQSENQVEITTINKVSQMELFKSFEEWLAQSSKTVLTKLPLNSPLFTTVNDLSPRSKGEQEMRNVRHKLETSVGSEPKKAKICDRKTEPILADLGIVLSDGDFREEMNVPQGNSVSGRGCSMGGKEVPVREGTSTPQGLSQAESVIFEEVLSGIDLEEFEM